MNDVEFAYGAAPVLKGLSLAIGQGEFVGIAGPNGSGKTTLIRLLTKILKARHGEIRLQGRPIEAYRPRALARIVAVVPQDTVVPFPYRVREIVHMGRFPHLRSFGFEGPEDHRIVDEAMESTGITPFAERLIGELSGGEKQRVFIARALAQRPTILLLDEPSAFLDLGHEIAIYDLLHRLNHDYQMTVVVVSHNLNQIAHNADRLFLLHQGRIFCSGTPQEVISEEAIEAVFGVRVSVVQSNGLVPIILPKRKVK